MIVDEISKALDMDPLRDDDLFLMQRRPFSTVTPYASMKLDPKAAVLDRMMSVDDIKEIEELGKEIVEEFDEDFG
eukprot:jgi/Hompol1/4217/HPOL_003587-RA